MRSRKRRKMDTGAAKARLFKGRARRPCAYCGEMLTIEQATFDHIVPLSEGGYDKTKNGVIACHDCNQAKGSMSACEFRSLIASRAVLQQSAKRFSKALTRLASK